MKVSSRDSNMDLLRCILIIMVVTVHYINAGMGGAIAAVKPGTINYYFIYLIESLSIICVDGFVILSGYYGINRSKTSFRKPFGLLLTVIGYNYLFFFIGTGLRVDHFSVNQLILNIIPQNWYVTLFVVLYIFAPYLNLIIHNLSLKQLGTLAIVGVLVFSAWENVVDIIIMPHTNTVGGISSVTATGGASGYSIVNFILLYFIGAFIKEAKVSLGKYKALAGYIAMSLVVFIGSLFSNKFWNYDNLFVILEAVFLVLFFEKMHIKSRLVSWASASTLGVFIIHTKYLVCYKAWSYFEIGKYSNKMLPLLILNMIVVIGLTFVVCTVFDWLLRYLLKPVSRVIDKNKQLTRNVIDMRW